MPLAISNLLWAKEEKEDDFLRAAKAYGVSGIEVAPGRIAPWEEMDDRKVAAYRQKVNDAGLLIPSMQAIFFGCQGMGLLGDTDSFTRMAEHLRRVAGVAQALGAGVLVFGAPKNRLRGKLSEEEAFLLAAERLSLVAQDMTKENVRLVIEAVPAVFGGDFIHTTQEAAQLVRKVGHDAIRLHLDSAAMITAQERPENILRAHADSLAHVHASVPGMGVLTPFGAVGRALDLCLAENAYKGWISIEVMPQEDPLPCLKTSILIAKETFVESLGA